MALSPGLEQQPVEVILAAAYAGLARVATARRNEIIGGIPALEEPDGISDRQIGSSTDLSHTIVARIRRAARKVQ